VTHPSLDIPALIGSRICHDLISPVGAISNGLELLAMTGTPPGPEMALVSDSAANASARIRLFRLAFGAASAGQQVASDEVAEILRAVFSESRIDLRWQAVGPQDRQQVKAALLAMLCVESALPGSGTITLARDGDGWVVRAEAPRLILDAATWAMLNGAPPPADLPPAAVQFALLPEILDALDRRATLQSGDTTLELSF
jgi:histidine phosphotransferase ChpT